MAGSTPHPSASSPDDAGNGSGSFLETELHHSEEVPRRRRPRMPVWLLPTMAALVTGLLLGALLAPGTDQSSAGVPATPGTAVAAPAPGSAANAVASLARAEPVAVDIPAIEVSTPLVDLGLNSDGTLEVPVDFSKAGWFTGGNAPGDPEGPPALLAGHVDDRTDPAVFFRLPELEIGDEVLVTRADNSVAVFTVSDRRQYPKDALPTDEIYAPVDESEVVLITCTGAFDETAGSYLDNLVVRATLDMARSLEETERRLASGLAAPAADLPNV